MITYWLKARKVCYLQEWRSFAVPEYFKVH
jgi:hypothetical protein